MNKCAMITLVIQELDYFQMDVHSITRTLGERLSKFSEPSPTVAKQAVKPKKVLVTMVTIEYIY